ncbi:MAG: hypothetical protein EAZ55_07425 [Cytophagales bacterium]|nr:MAG: hypothetical protein EAZ55_07425 [Cytophagales bacterium]
MKYYCTFIILLTFISLQKTFAQDTWESTLKNKKGQVVVFYNEDLPFVYGSAEKKLQGIEYDIFYDFIKFTEKNYQITIEVDWQPEPDFEDFYARIRASSPGSFGIGSVTITKARSTEVQFAPPYMPDIEVVVSSANTQVFESEASFKTNLKKLRAVTIANSTFERNIQNIKQLFWKDLQYQAVNSTDQMVDILLKEDNRWGYLHLVRYFLLFNENKKLQRQKFFVVKNEGLAFIMPLESDWNEPLKAYFTSKQYKDKIKPTIQKYIGAAANDLIWQIASDTAKASGDEMRMLALEKDLNELELREQQLELQKKQLELNNQSLIIQLGIAGLLIIGAVTFVLYYRNRISKNINKALSSQNKEIAEQSELLQQSYQSVELLSEIGRTITSHLSFKNIALTVYESINDLLDASELAIAFYVPEEDMLISELYFYEGTQIPGIKIDPHRSDRLSSLCFSQKKEIIMGNIQQEYSQYIDDLSGYKQGDLLTSIICLPLMQGEEAIGFISVQSRRKNAYNDYQINILRNVAIYTAIALNNANAYKKIGTQNEEIRKQKDLIERKNTHIMSSIRSALTIQEAILPFENRLRHTLGANNYFVVYIPKDIVSGDFYWLSKINDTIVMAVLDCTGHGVPGAFMSMIGYTLMNETVNEKKILDPAEILIRMHEQVRFALRQSETGNKESIDACVCVWEEPKDDNQKINLRFAGAKRPLYYYHNQEIQECKGDRSSLGGFIKNRFADETTFQTHHIELKKGDIIYLTTDGYVDVPNEKRKSFGKTLFLEMLKKNAHKNLYEQKEVYIQNLRAYQNDSPQRDDITLIGISL